MKPVEKIAELYLLHPEEGPFFMKLGQCLEFGTVVSTPDIFIMGYPIEGEDTWFIEAAAGDLSKVLQFIPYPLRWVRFARRGNTPKTYDFNSLVRRIRKPD